ncbi:MAG: DNA alkylation repair protein [Gemmatimonas sp.]
MPHTLESTLARLESLGNERVRTLNHRAGSGDNQYGVQLGDIRKIAADIKSDDQLAFELWSTGNLDAQLLAILLFKPRTLTVDDLDEMVEAIGGVQVADWFSAYIVRKHAGKEKLRERWMKTEHAWRARAGWDLTAERIGKAPVGLDLNALLDRIERELGSADPRVQWTMNNSLAGIGIHFAEHRKRALAIGEKIGAFRDYPVSKGCTSPFAPVWINEMVKRKTS